MIIMSMIGLYNYDNTIFDDMAIPEGIDLEILRDAILTECASFNVMYPDPSFFRSRLYLWSRRKLPIWTKLYATTQYEYDPIANYDRTEEHSETIEHTGTDSRSGSNSSQSSGTRTNTGTVQDGGTDSSTESRTGYNSIDLQVVSQINGTSGNTRTDNLTEAVSSTAQGSLTDVLTRDMTDTVTRRIRAYGNIGVTTTQQMIESERAIDVYDIYAIILSDFIDAFCVQVY